MERHKKILCHTAISIAIFLFSFFLRRFFFCGFILGDDCEEFSLLQYLTSQGVNFEGHLQYRFGLWLFNILFFKLLGISETTFFLPTWIMSSSMGVIGYFIILRWQYRIVHAILGSLFIATTPFEILIGTVRANDLILSWLLVLGLLFFILFEKRSVLQGTLLAFFLWFAFYTKLWVIYLLPPIGIYYLLMIIRNKTWRGFFSFSITTLILHIVTCIFWKIRLGTFLPFIAKHSATYPVAMQDLWHIFQTYPSMIFRGSEFGTTLFGFIPYLLPVLLTAKFVLSKFFKKYLQWDRFDTYLLVYYASFFLFLNFFPNSFSFDQYYSAPRIFRYLAPLSFPMSLHLAKLVIDFSRIKLPGIFAKKNTFIISLFLPLIAVNFYQTNNATMPGQIYRKTLTSILKDIEKQSPPQLLAESWLGFFLRNVYLKSTSHKTYIVPIYHVHIAKDYERWLEQKQPALPEGTMLISGFGNYVHYGAYYNGFLLRQFQGSLDPGWKLFKEYGMLSYLPLPEPARLWKLSGKITRTDMITSPECGDILNINNVDTLFKEGMNNFEKDNYIKARAYFKKIITESQDSYAVNDALYFYAMCYFREFDWRKALDEFKNLINNYPDSQWIAGSHYHTGLIYRELSDEERAYEEFYSVINHFPSDTNLVNLSKKQLEELSGIDTDRGSTKTIGIINRISRKLFSR